MYRLFNMLLQNLTNMNVKFTEVTYNENYINIDYIDTDGNKYTGWFRKVEEFKDA